MNTSERRLSTPISHNKHEANIRFTGLKRNLFGDIYYTAMVVSWPLFIFLSGVAYLLLNTIFTTLYFVGGDVILNARPGSYLDAFIFSFQTSTTIGYGSLLPKTTYAHIVAMFDVFCGLMFVALLTGLAFARFTRPSARVIFSDNILITKHKNQDVMLLRIANGRRSLLVNTDIRVVVLKENDDETSLLERDFYDLTLQRDHMPIFAMTWLVMHVINEDSPLHGLDQTTLKDKGIQIFVSLTGIEDLFAQTVHVKQSYNWEHVLFDKQFVNPITWGEDGVPLVDFNYFHDVIDAPK